MIKLRNKYAIGTHVMWYEHNIIQEFIQSIINSCETVENKENILIHFDFNMTEFFEKLDTSTITMEEIKRKFISLAEQLESKNIPNTYKFIESNDSPYTQAHSRRDLNYHHCEHFDYIIWGESDCLAPKQTFESIEQISEYASGQGFFRYIITFATRKMWDDSWKPLEHNEMTDLPYYEKPDVYNPNHLAYTSPHSIRYTMNIDEMNEINDRQEDTGTIMIRQPKFDGSFLVISSDLIKAGANIPHGANWMGDDTGMLLSCYQVMGASYLQFIVKNILKVHNRDHPKKRSNIVTDTGEASSQNNKGHIYEQLRNYTKWNVDRLVNKQDKFLTFEEIKNRIPDWKWPNE